MIKRICHNYKKWEDWKGGMYNRKNNEQNLIEKSKNLLSNPVAFQYSASTMVEHWKYSAEMNLTDMSQNRRAWIGQATCCFEYQTPEHTEEREGFFLPQIGLSL